jgi:hypothetical protein
MALQITDEDLDAAIASGAMTAGAADNLRAFVERRRAAPAADEESFRLLTGFNDIFVSIALLMSLLALGWLAHQVVFGFAGGVVAAASWALAEFFTRVRRMALPSILLLFGFVGGVTLTATSLVTFQPVETYATARILAVGAAGAFAAYLHWRRFKVPVTIAAGVLTAGAAGAVAVRVLSHAFDAQLYFILAAGLATFALALAWDASDVSRRTRRSDVAFWLHLLAAPAIVHSAFSLLGLSSFSLFGVVAPDAPAAAGAWAALLALALYAALGLVALIVDRRALMVSSLAYLLFAMNSLFRATGALTISIALSALVVGVGLLLLSAFWATARRYVLRFTPVTWRTRLPPTP